MGFKKNTLIDEFTAASEGHRLAKVLAIRAVERMSGQHRLKKIYLDYGLNSKKQIIFGLI